MSPIKKTSAVHIVLPTIAPLILVVGVGPVTMLFVQRYDLQAAPIILIVWCLALAATGFWMTKVLFESSKISVPSVAAVAVILGIWLWQKLAFVRLVPTSGLSYGFFLTPEGARARFWVLTCPFWCGVICLSLLVLFAVVLWWRSGARALLLCMIPWWLATVLVFALPSMYLDGQGNASFSI